MPNNSAGARFSGPTPEGVTLGQRVLGAVIFVVVFLGTLIWGEIPFTIAITVVAIIASVEMFTMFETKGEAVPTAAVLGVAGAAAFVLFAHWRPIESIGYVTIGIVFLTFVWYMLVLRHVKPTKAIALTVLAPLLAGLCLSYLVMLRDIVDRSAPAGAPRNQGLWIVIFLIVLIWIFDLAAWFVGRKIGRNKMAPAISPNKSWEGTIAGVIAVLAASVILRIIIQAILGHNKFTWFSYGVAIGIGVIVCILGPLGDLAESMMKRDYGVKDMGSIIPGHGGVMDRMDSTLFTAPATFYLIYFILPHVRLR